MTDAEKILLRIAIAKWCTRHEYRRWNGSHYERTKRNRTERIYFDMTVVRFELLRVHLGVGKKCPFVWETLAEAPLVEVSIDPITDKLEGLE